MTGLRPIQPHKTDYDFLSSFGATTPDPEGLPENFSVYDGREVPDQNQDDQRFPFSIPALPQGCTAESGTFDSGIQDNDLYNPQDLYLHTPDYNPYTGRDIRAMFSTLKEHGLLKADGTLTGNRSAYFNVYGSFRISDADAVRIAIWVNQYEKRSVYIGSWWEWGNNPQTILPEPTYLTKNGTLHCYLCTGWKTIDGTLYLEIIPWLGKNVGDSGKFYMDVSIYNKLMIMPYTAAFTVTKGDIANPVALGLQAHTDHVIYSLVQFIRNLFNV